MYYYFYLFFFFQAEDGIRGYKVTGVQTCALPVPVPARGEWAQVVLDEATYGTRCGDGTSYAFWIHLAPEGFPVDRVVVDMQGGGVCLFESDCLSSSAGGLLNAFDENPPTTGYQS